MENIYISHIQHYNMEYYECLKTVHDIIWKITKIKIRKQYSPI